MSGRIPRPRSLFFWKKSPKKRNPIDDVEDAYLVGWKYRFSIASIIGFVLLFTYPVILDPMLNVDKYKEINELVKKELDEELRSPGRLRPWKDPFKRGREEDE